MENGGVQIAKILKSFQNFHLIKNAHGGYAGVCKECARIRNLKYVDSRKSNVLELKDVYVKGFLKKEGFSNEDMTPELIEIKRQQLKHTNNKLINGEIDIKVAQHISASTQVLINAARLQLDIFKATNKVQRFLEEPSTIEDCKEIAQKAVEMNNSENFDEVTDKRPFDF